MILLVVGMPVSTLAAGSRSGEMESYTVLERVYPFQQPVTLLNRLEEMLKQEASIVIGIMPVYDHTDYPAMTEFLEVMRYAQSGGCCMLLHFPLIYQEQTTALEVITVLEPVLEFYEQEGIHIQGILLGKDEAPYREWEEELETFLPVFYVDDAGILKTEKLKQMNDPYEPVTIPENYDFHRNVVDQVSVSLENQNKVLFVIVTASIVIFVGMIIYARWLNKKKFFEEEEEDQ